ncbi:MAG: hypothetical protein WAO20_01780 [Acidobacteriota bacterium]
MKRRDDELPVAVDRWGWRYHHTGIPTEQKREGETYLPEFGMYVCGFPDSPYGIEWMRFEPDSPISQLVQTVPHVAFEVDSIEQALQGKYILTQPCSPSPGVIVAMIIDDGCPIELLEFERGSAQNGRAASSDPA